MMIPGRRKKKLSKFKLRSSFGKMQRREEAILKEQVITTHIVVKVFD